ncbi:MAG: LysM peptidoglycan-binding domain-containing protein [Planctomycetes bacterium]|nr:LysM peptidoglycan-binding domain-containing protein [Planctomycetota bacterium]
MGNFEKLIVLGVLLVAAVVLAISFSRGSDVVEASDPLTGAHRLLGEQPLEERAAGELPATGLEPQAGKITSTEAAPSLLLNAGDGGVEAEFPPTSAGLQPAGDFAPSALSLEPASDPTRRILLDTTALRPSFLDDLMVYTVVEGDTWSSLAQRFYQDGRYTRNLQRANDDLTVLTPGSDVFVPIYDFFAAEVEPQVGADFDELNPSARARPAAVAPSSTGAFEGAPVSSIKAAMAKALEYEVKPGDTLSDISLAVFGTATRWKELLEANGDKLRTPESLQVGMKLKIPEGGKLPVAGVAKSVAKKTEKKPATTPAKSESTPKKKKVL